MIGLLDRALQRLLSESGADVAVIWSRIAESGVGSVVCSHPVDLLPSGMPWPATEEASAGIIHRDAEAVARLVPTSVRLELASAPTAALSLELGDPHLMLLLIWCGPKVGDGLSEAVGRLIAEEIGDLARMIALQDHHGRAAQRLQGVVDDLKQGVVSVDHALDQVTMNPAAARLLNLHGRVAASEFAAAMAKLEGRALNRTQIASMGQRMLADPWTEVDCTWTFAADPTHVHVTSRAVRHGAVSERIWVFEDVSGPFQAMAASDATQALLRANADSMLDPQVLLEAVREPTGRVIDFRYLNVNAAACLYLGLQESDLVGHTQLEAAPNLEGSELHQRYIRCLEDGEPVVLDDYSFFNEILGDDRRYDVRATRAGADLISLTWSDVTERFAAAQRVLLAQTLLHATVDSMLNPQVLFEAVRDPGGRVVDFVYRTANQATCSYLGLEERELVGQSALATLPNLEGSGLLGRYRECVETGAPVVLDDFSYFNEILDDGRRYDIRATRAGVDLISLTWSDVTERFRAAQSIAAAQERLRATVDSMLNPQSLLEAVRDPGGRAIDFVYRSANRAFCSYRGSEERDIIGQSLVQAQPALVGSELFEQYVDCVDTGKSVVLDDFELFNAMLGQDRRFDIRVVRAGVDLISLTFSDVTESFHAARRIAESEVKYRLLAENSSDTVTHLRDGRFVWVSPSVEGVLGGSPAYWVGRHVRDIVPDEDAADHAVRFTTLNEGGSLKERVRVVAVDGVVHWVDLHAKPFYDDAGRPDGFTAALRLADDEVAAEQAAAEARRLKAKADERYRRSIDYAAVGMCLTTPDGRFEEVNAALCHFFGYTEDNLKQLDWQQLTAPEYLEADVLNVGKIMSGQIDSYRLTKQFIHAHGHRVWGDLSVGCLRNSAGDVESFIAQITDVTAELETRELYQLLAENASDVVVHGRAGKVVWISPSVEDVLGGSPEYWIGRPFSDVVPPDQEAEFASRRPALAEGGAVQHRAQLVALDGTRHWFHFHAKPFYGSDGRPDGFTASLRVIDDEVAAEQQVEEARRLQARADERYRRSMDNAAIGMCLSSPSGRFEEVNVALCEFFGYDAQTLMQKTWQELTAPEYQEESATHVADLIAGRTDSYRAIKAYIHADGHRIWGDISGSCLRDANGTVEYLAAQVADITATVEAEERNVLLSERLQLKNDRMSAELASAAAYMSSIMPRGLAGKVAVSSRYLPSRELGGDCFDYAWIDDDHLLVYLIDVSGHGIEPALLAVSVHNMLRSGAFPVEALLAPETVLTELNRLFQMDQQNDHYFTLWLGVYQASTRTLRYSSAGAIPALGFDSTPGSCTAAIELPPTSMPIGMFEDAEFTSNVYSVPVGSRILISSDGASELDLRDGRQLTLADFIYLTTGVARQPNWTLDDLIAKLRTLTPTASFQDDCSLILLTFDRTSP